MVDQESFLKEVAKHRMRVELDEEVHRSIYFGEPATLYAHFRINTWPGHLCISGDMGTFVFSRTEDMFKFFRGDEINLGYWGEKVQSESANRGVMSFSADKLAESVRDYVADQGPNVKGMVEDDLIAQFDGEPQDVCIAMIYEWDGPIGFSDFVTDLSPICYSEYTPQFVWCCRAIVWAIDRYDKEHC